MQSPRTARILITRAPHQSSELADLLRARSLEPVLIPIIEFTAPSSFALLDNALDALPGFDWLLFTSANAVNAFVRRKLSRQPQTGSDASSLHPRGIAAIGPATAHALAAAGLVATLLPPQAVAESLAAALLPYALPGVHFLLVRAEEARDVLPDALRSAGADVTIAPAYRTVIPEGSVAQVRELFRGPETYPDAVTFTSSSSVRNLLALLQVAGVKLPSNIRRISIGPITSAMLREQGLPPHTEASEATVEALAEATLQALHAKE